MSNYYLSLPPELEEAARILGAGRLRSLIDITYPVDLPGYSGSAH